MLQDLSNLLELYDAIEGSWYDLIKRLASTPEGYIYEDQYLRRLYTTVTSDLFNGVYLATLPVNLVDQSIDEAVAFFIQRKCPFRWFTGPLTKPRTLGQQLLVKGFIECPPISVMALELDAMVPADTLSSRFKIQPVEDVETLRVWFQTLCQGYGITVDYPQTWFTLEATLGFRDDHIQRYLGYLRGKPVATSCRLYTRGVTRINFVSTIPEALGRGVGTAMTAKILQKAKLDGYNVALLYPTEMGQNLYRCFGFKEYCTIVSYRLSTMTSAR